MKRLAAITDKDITGAESISTATPRIAAGTILFDNEDNIALCHLGKFDFYTLPGGGVDAGEDLITAAKREVLEETGCDCEIIDEVGAVFESRTEDDFTQERYIFIARVMGEKGEPQPTDFEVFLASTVDWYPLKKALQLVTDSIPKDYQQKYIRHRNIIILNEVLKNHAHMIGELP